MDNPFTAIAIDQAGNQGSADRTIVRDELAAQIVLTEGNGGSGVLPVLPLESFGRGEGK